MKLFKAFVDALRPSPLPQPTAEPVSPEVAARAHASAVNIGEFRLEHARQTDRVKYLQVCNVRKIEPDLTSPPPPYYTGDYRDWAAATLETAH